MLDFLAIARDFGIPLAHEGHHHCKAGWIQTHCPMCSHGTGWHLGYSLNRGIFHCWRCGTLKGNDVLIALTKKKYAELRHKYGGTVRATSAKATPRARVLEKPPGCGPMKLFHRKYLQRRGFDADVIADLWGVQGCDRRGGLWRDRLIIPIYDETGDHWVSYTGRTVSTSVRPKYRTLEADRCLVDVTGLLYGHHLATGRSVVVVEGPFDAWGIGPGAVATLGAGWTSAQADKLRKYEYIYIMLDQDDAGKEHSKRLAAWLAPHRPVWIMDEFEGDPADMEIWRVEEFRQAVGL